MELDEKTFMLVKKAIQKKDSVYFTTKNVPITFQTRIIAQTKNHFTVFNAVSPEYIKAIMDSKNYFLQISTHRFHCEKIESDGEHILFPIKHASLLKDIRQEQRFSFSDDQKVFCEILNPYDMQTILRKPVIDLSASGVSIRNYFESELFKAKTHLPEIKILIDNAEHTSHSGEIIYIRKLMNLKREKSIQVGIKFF
ncbi:MAG: hypothetical protein AB8G05_00100 [Oligoflexales bacterium]